MHKEVRNGLTSPTATIMVRQAASTSSVPLRIGPFMLFVIVTAGIAEHVSGFGSHRVVRGSVMAMRSGEMHEYLQRRGFQAYEVHVGLEVFSSELAWLARDPDLAVVLRRHLPSTTDDPEGVHAVDEETLTQLEAWCGQIQHHTLDGAHDQASRLGHLVLILAELAAAMRGNPATDLSVARPHPSAVRAAQLLQDNFTRNWTLTILAHLVNLAPGYLVRIFRQHYGVPPMAYLSRVRCQRASVLLAETDLPIATIGATVGWADPAYLSRRFKAAFLMSPAQYRASFRRSPENNVTIVQALVTK